LPAPRKNSMTPGGVFKSVVCKQNLRQGILFATFQATSTLFLFVP
jgi:hypothetical protein